MIFKIKPRFSTRTVRRHAFRPSRDKFIIAGRIINKLSGDGIGGLYIRAFDYDRTYDDPAGMAYSDELGFFRIEYPRSRFVKLDHAPELYIDVSDESGQVLYVSSRRRVRCGSVELVNINLTDSIRICGKDRLSGDSRHSVIRENMTLKQQQRLRRYAKKVGSFRSRLPRFWAYQKRLLK